MAGTVVGRLRQSKQRFCGGIRAPKPKRRRSRVFADHCFTERVPPRPANEETVGQGIVDRAGQMHRGWSVTPDKQAFRKLPLLRGFPRLCPGVVDSTPKCSVLCAERNIAAASLSVATVTLLLSDRLARRNPPQYDCGRGIGSGYSTSPGDSGCPGNSLPL